MSEEFGVYHVEVEGRTVSDLSLVNALAKAVVTSPRRLTTDLGGTKLAFAAGVLEALLPPRGEERHDQPASSVLGG